jgi:hypothetical protein
MSLTIHDLLQQKTFPDVRLVAGEKGINNVILWVNIMEILDTPKAVQPGELLLTTGYGLDQEELHRSLLPQLSKRGVSGIAIQLGYYIDEIPPYLLSQADALNFPVLVVPKSLTFSEFLHTMVRIIDSKPKSEWNRTTLDHAYAALSSALSKNPALTTQEHPEQCTHVLLLEPVNYTSAAESAWQKCLVEISSFLQANSKHAITHNLPQHRCIFLVTHPRLKDFLSMFYRLNIRLTLLSEEFGVNCFLGGGQLPACGSLSLSIDHALEGLVTLHLIKARRGVCLYDHIDFLKLFGKIHQKDGSIVLDNLHLQHLMDYDRINKSGYLQTLRVYLANNCNITQTAKQLFLHRHTLINRLEKIEEISGLYLDDYYSRLYISIAMFLHDYFIY